MNRKLELSPLARARWPENRPLPTSDEIAAAEQRYLKTSNAQRISDYGAGFEFVMATYNPHYWLPFFFPELPAQPNARYGRTDTQ